MSAMSLSRRCVRIDRSGRMLFVLLGVGVVVLLAIYGSSLFGGPSPERLAHLAINADSAADRLEAARQLSQMGQPAVDFLRKVSVASEDNSVISICILGLARESDHQSMDLFLSSLEHTSADIRAAASKAVVNILGRNHHFPVDGQPAERARIKEQIVNDWNSYNGSELFKFNQNRQKKESAGRREK